MDFVKFPSIGRHQKPVVITEKIDGTNGIIAFNESMEMFVGSRNRWLSPADDNYGFCKWCWSNVDELKKLGPGYHYGEWWGQGIQRRYDLKEKRFSLFNTARWNPDNPNKPECCGVVPVLYFGPQDVIVINEVLTRLKEEGSVAAPGFMKPEGIVIFHSGTNTYSKTTFEGDVHKWELK